MELELVGLVSDGEVALGDPVPAGLEGHLVAGQPALVAHHRRAVDGRAVDVIVDVTAQVDVLTLVAGLDLAALLADETEETEDRLLMFITSRHVLFSFFNKETKQVDWMFIC